MLKKVEKNDLHINSPASGIAAGNLVSLHHLGWTRFSLQLFSVFVPQQRTALLDILLGKTTLKQVTARRRSRSRSTSHSPVRRKSLKGTLGDNGEPALLPRVKKGRKSVIEVVHNDEGPFAGMTISLSISYEVTR